MSSIEVRNRKYADTRYTRQLVKDVRADAIDECINTIDSWIEKQGCFKGTLKYISTNLFEELEKLKEQKNDD